MADLDVHGFTEGGSIDVTVDGQRMTVPDDLANRHRQMVAEWEADGHTIPAYQSPPPSAEEVDAERDRRVAAGFSFAGNMFQSRPEDLANINGAATLAAAALLTGAQSGDLRWADAANDFAWLNLDNQPISMDAPTVLAFGKAAMQHKSALIWKGRALKDLSGTEQGIPADFVDDAYWTTP